MQCRVFGQHQDALPDLLRRGLVFSVLSLPDFNRTEMTTIPARRDKARARRGVAKAPGHTRLGVREERTQLLLAWAGFLTTPQVTLAAGYPKPRRAQSRLRVLLDHGQTKIILQGGALHRPSIHMLTDLGREHLVEHGLLDPAYRIPRLPREQKRAHALLVRDVFAALAAADGMGRLRLQDFRFEGELSHVEPFRQLGLVPDAMATVVPESGQSRTLCLEADASTETTTTLRKKFSRWRALLDGWVRPLPLLLVVTARDGRRCTLAAIMTETGLDTIGIVRLRSDLQNFVNELNTTRDPSARLGRSERGTVLSQPSRVTVLSSQTNAAFRLLRSE
jgi:hypothetical protein